MFTERFRRKHDTKHIEKGKYNMQSKIWSGSSVDFLTRQDFNYKSFEETVRLNIQRKTRCLQRLERQHDSRHAEVEWKV